MHRLGLAIITLGLLGAAPVARAQIVRYGVLDDPARSQLRAAWSDDSMQSERGYCVRRARIVVHPISPTAVDSVFRVLEVVPARSTEADPNHVEFTCAAGTPELHTHTPATCVGSSTTYCSADGPGAYSCQPSRQDYEKLIRRGDPFGVIQCDRRAFRFYYPSDFLAHGDRAHTSTGSDSIR
ncbi:MAG TPA: hypothetical protein VN677_09170 [Gemmatimonadaceae bacterium]|nr:hypothetical protein [Gemmatimonadaceae bacterium]